MENAARAERLTGVSDEAVALLYRAAEHRLLELLRRARSAPMRLAPALPSLHVVPRPSTPALVSPQQATAPAAALAFSSAPVTRARGGASVRCAGIVAPIDLVRALRLHTSLLAEDAAVNRERASLCV